MYYVVIGYDGTDEHALERRLKVREQHLSLGEKNYNEGKLLYAVAILDDNGKMIGSILTFDFATKADLDHYLNNEPYIVHKVWERWEAKRCQPGPLFVPKAKV